MMELDHPASRGLLGCLEQRRERLCMCIGGDSELTGPCLALLMDIGGTGADPVKTALCARKEPSGFVWTQSAIGMTLKICEGCEAQATRDDVAAAERDWSR